MAPPPNGFPMDHFTHNTVSSQHLDFGNDTRMAHNFVQPYWDASADAGLASAVKQDVFGQEVLGYTPVSPTHPFYDAQVLDRNVASPDWSRKHEDPARQYGFPTIVPRPAEQRRLSQSHARPASRASAAQVEKSQHVPEREGRFRTHQYYSAKPREDGYYYCPYKDCSHKPTKLKCNYDPSAAETTSAATSSFLQLLAFSATSAKLTAFMGMESVLTSANTAIVNEEATSPSSTTMEDSGRRVSKSRKKKGHASGAEPTRKASSSKTREPVVRPKIAARWDATQDQLLRHAERSRHSFG
ncbi:hypothetical protein B9Z65_5837 [Elsinoe australis]|uniref:Uncharacterized protein n=1 Tax=Elsinoe australis TaxID=40998 RepID=A0A2P7YJ67_9PEZI|nr:hypothetical protein B9Z65_5837 [Elsinoe australis]